MAIKLKNRLVAGIIVVFTVGFFYYISKPRTVGHTKEDKTFYQVNFIASYIELYKRENGDYPSENKGLMALFEPSEHGPYFLKKDGLLDSWGREIIYKRINCDSKSSYVIYSVGDNCQYIVDTFSCQYIVDKDIFLASI